ncbi:hypothetical protein [Streptomyces sp. NBC_01443]|uniref:vWA-MoxR associated conflict system protein n=1 Tax=Streptomyces sp. NBC_01443 TaxID=2903868 RepID=UPI00338E305B
MDWLLVAARTVDFAREWTGTDLTTARIPHTLHSVPAARAPGVRYGVRLHRSSRLTPDARRGVGRCARRRR